MRRESKKFPMPFKCVRVYNLRYDDMAGPEVLMFMESARRKIRIGGTGLSSRSAGRERGSALLIVLAFIVILAVVLTAFLSNSQRAFKQSESSSTILKTQLLGQVAAEAIIGDLREEMRAGADEYPAEGAVMKVSQPWAMVPSRVVKDSTMLTNPDYANLVKQSISGKGFYPGNSPAVYTGTAASRALATSTLSPSKNQRVVSAVRWDRPRLLGGANGLAQFTDQQVPDWILITRNGAAENAADVGEVADGNPANLDFILGRFAFNIYRVDGLLDINVAGFPPGEAADAVGKGSQAWADLRALPGLENDTSVSALVNWRNKLTKSDFPAMIGGLAPGATSSVTPGTWGEPGGFLLPYSDGSQTDNRFFGRQDLLHYFDHQFGTSGDERDALPFLTTFSADLNQPSLRPDKLRPRVERNALGGGNDAHGDAANPENLQINPPFLDVQDGSDEPVVKQRFPLERLKYLVPDPPDATKARILEYFGLTWSNGSWVYSEGAPIKRLSALNGAKPNMIQLLKAAIEAGSLGGQLNYGEPRATYLMDRDSSIDYQVIRIAASLIDQYDSDGYPTCIDFGGYTVCGVEDIPYLYGLRATSYRQQQLNMATDVSGTNKPTIGSSGLYRHVVMIQPIVWNPHSPSAGGNRPSQFRITANTRGAIDVQPQSRKVWWHNGDSYYSDWPSTTGDPRDTSVPRSFSPMQDYMTFTISSNNQDMAAFREPYTLKAPNYPQGSNARAFDQSGEILETTLGVTEQNDTAAGENSTRAIGFRAGWVWGGPWLAASISGTSTTWMQEGNIDTNGIDFDLQYQTASGDWVTYDTYEKFTSQSFRLDRASSGVTAVNPRNARYFLRADPRTDRYGTRIALLMPNATGWPQGQSLRIDAGPGVAIASGWPSDPAKFNFTVNADKYLGLLSSNKANDVLKYDDPDGVHRLAMGGYSDGVTGLPMALGNMASRPVVLNRPFRSVAELGAVMRDQPWKQLDFFTPESGDAALLDIFCLYEPKDADAEPIVAGRVNLNTARPEVIKALLKGVEQQTGDILGDVETAAVAQAVVDWTTSTDTLRGPLRNRSELAGRFVQESPPGTYVYSGVSSAIGDALSTTSRAIPQRRQNILRALVDPGTTRTWSFLIDLIVQDGRFTKPGAVAGDFVVRGEKRYWIHVALDRFTGKVILERVEEVNE
jgi:hypothetical protein